MCIVYTVYCMYIIFHYYIIYSIHIHTVYKYNICGQLYGNIQDKIRVFSTLGMCSDHNILLSNFVYIAQSSEVKAQDQSKKNTNFVET